MPIKGTTVVNQCRERNLIKEYLIQAVCRMPITCELYDPAHCTISEAQWQSIKAQNLTI